MTSATVEASALAGLGENAWLRFAARRLGRLVVSVWVLVTAAFLMIHLIPGDPVRAALGLQAPEALVKARRAALGLNEPLGLQYAHWLQNLLAGRMGTSITSDLPVSQVISQHLPATVQLAVLAFVVAMLISVPLGALMAVLTRAGRVAGLSWRSRR